MDSPWRLLPVAEIEPVQPAAEARARSWLRELAARLRGKPRSPVDPTPSRDRLGPLDEARLARLVPDPPLAPQRAAFDALRGRTRRAIVHRRDGGRSPCVCVRSRRGAAEATGRAAARLGAAGRGARAPGRPG